MLQMSKIVKASDTEASSMLTWCRWMLWCTSPCLEKNSPSMVLWILMRGWKMPRCCSQISSRSVTCKLYDVICKLHDAAIEYQCESTKTHPWLWRSSIPSNACPALWPGHLMQPHWCHSADVNLSKGWPLSVLSKDIRCLFQNMYSIRYILGVSFNFII